ncbi:hypothetical protein AGR7C_Cc120079 [Agrobacterium deltaense Zutra 3/1]|uniref:Uncharacterized protein n=1 Tax=Agrobacterium deltaense Zutra 3/1 TaxID=1183427 RepID=A0A1S7PAQ5_9HYPH|nr:hypothetical protein AGR7C_Cc120079 [Agrobacterium deltaense Zutra 3/1]
MLQWLLKKNVRLTALGTFRSFTGFPILPPHGQAPDREAMGKKACGCKLLCGRCDDVTMAPLTSVIPALSRNDGPSFYRITPRGNT